MTGWDLNLFWHINRDWTHPVLDWLMPALSAIEAWLPVLLLTLVILALRGSRRIRVMLGCLAIALVVSDAVIGNGLKKLCNRVRPRDQMSGVMIRDLGKASPRFLALFKAPAIKTSEVKKVPTTGNSMPSNHTVNLFAAATVIALFYRRWSLAMYALACGVAYSRVYVGAHWPSDLPPSAMLGILVGWMVTYFVMPRLMSNAEGSGSALR